MEKEREYKILVATGIEALDLSVAELKQCNVLGRCQNKETLREEVGKRAASGSAFGLPAGRWYHSRTSYSVKTGTPLCSFHLPGWSN